ncbi:hypothetical protein M2D63_021100 [Pseudomonas sp. BJa5]|uniref:hypothetical protein n=1 Tax=Pseudomonas sp. BJa5 TaxID=2936270 RepID=UPI002559B6AF|nr:hypothetical protein [Pseudomonas sp. BGr12]MDL2423611.1 hypothetical protein [Pseudomonas sp. BGr12]
MTKFESAPTLPTRVQKKPRSPSLRTLPPLTVGNALPDLDPNQPNLLPSSEVSAELQIAYFTENAPPGAGFIALYLLPDLARPIFTEAIAWPPAANDFPLTFSVGLELLGGHGIKDLRYIVTNSVENESGSGTLRISIDRLPPHNGLPTLPLSFPADLPDGVITPSYLDAHGGVTFGIPDYIGWAPGDRFEVFWRNQVAPIASGAVNNFPLSFTLDAELIRGFGEGTGELSYRLYDYAGNPTTREDTRTEIRVLLKDPPANLPLPRIPQASGEDGEDLFISLNEARGGAIVLIDAYDNAQDGDRIVVKLGAREVDDTVLSSGYTFPIELELPYAELMGHSGAPQYRENVSYYVFRHFETPSDAVAVDFDLRVPGPGPDPENPSPINDELEQADLIPAVSTEMNKLTPEDVGEDAIIRVPLYPGATETDVLRVLYQGQLVEGSERSPTAAEIAQGHMDFVLPWARIEEVGNGLRDVAYELSDGDWDKAHQRSPAQAVEVSVISLLVLAPPQVVSRTSPGGFINCSSAPWLGIRVRLQDASNVRVGDTYELSWHMIEVTDWTPPITEEPIESTRTTFSGTFSTAAEVTSGIVIDVPWEPNIYPAVQGYVAMTWKTHRESSSKGRSLEPIGQSAEARVVFSRRAAGGCICDAQTSCTRVA